jgi:hypothetical protein
VETFTLLVARARASVTVERNESCTGPLASNGFPRPPLALLSVPLIPAAVALPWLAAIKMFVGSSSSSPALPFGASVLTVPLKSSQFFPETSTDPPLPPFAPPRALMLP